MLYYKPSSIRLEFWFARKTYWFVCSKNNDGETILVRDRSVVENQRQGCTKTGQEHL